MRRVEIDSWARSIIERVKNLQPSEDSFVECKSSWEDAKDAAPRLAALANSSHGELVMWLIGVDEKKGIITGADKSQDIANWWSSVQKWFDEVFPKLVDYIAIPLEKDNKTVFALVFETDLAPYVVKNSNGGLISQYVPWRDGTRLRAAKRSEL